MRSDLQIFHLEQEEKMMGQPNGLVACIYPKYFNSAAFGSLTNCFTFLTGFDEGFHNVLGEKPIRPEDLGWTSLATKEEWIAAVTTHFNPQLPAAHAGSAADRFGEEPHPASAPLVSHAVLSDSTGLHWTPPCVPALCFPMVRGALDYHWAVYNGVYWLEQAGDGGPINVWATIDGLLENVYDRRDAEGLLYVRDSHFFFSKRIA
jgi:hypothetical protein